MSLSPQSTFILQFKKHDCTPSVMHSLQMPVHYWTDWTVQLEASLKGQISTATASTIAALQTALCFAIAQPDAAFSTEFEQTEGRITEGDDRSWHSITCTRRRQLQLAVLEGFNSALEENGISLVTQSPTQTAQSWWACCALGTILLECHVVSCQTYCIPVNAQGPTGA